MLSLQSGQSLEHVGKWAITELVDDVWRNMIGCSQHGRGQFAVCSYMARRTRSRLEWNRRLRYIIQIQSRHAGIQFKRIT
jgi:hypothetical protein